MYQQHAIRRSRLGLIALGMIGVLFACGDDPITAECNPDKQTRCDGQTFMVCNSSGRWEEGEVCADLCTEEGCTSCDGAVQVTRRGDEVAREECAYACHMGMCVTCSIPGERSCDGDQPRECLADGSYRVEPACEGQCVNGECSCERGDQRCVDGELRVCDGDAFAPQAECEFGCLDAETCRECENDGELSCDGRTVVSCEGGLLERGDSCSDACFEGECVECVPGTSVCDGDTVQLCGSDGTYAADIVCGRDSCSDGACSCDASYKRVEDDHQVVSLELPESWSVTGSGFATPSWADELRVAATGLVARQHPESDRSQLWLVVSQVLAQTYEPEPLLRGLSASACEKPAVNSWSNGRWTGAIAEATCEDGTQFTTMYLQPSDASYAVYLEFSSSNPCDDIALERILESIEVEPTSSGAWPEKLWPCETQFNQFQTPGGEFAVEVPARWGEPGFTTWEGAPALVAALDFTQDVGNSPAVVVSINPELGAAGVTPNILLQALGAPANCTAGGPAEFSFGAYSGVFEEWSCGSYNLHRSAFAPADGSFVGYVRYFRLNPRCDQDYLLNVYNSLQVATPVQSE